MSAAPPHRPIATNTVDSTTGFGEDFATIILFNFFCIGTSGFFFWLMLRNRLSEGSPVRDLG